jgi:FkbM family methyltransferase
MNSLSRPLKQAARNWLRRQNRDLISFEVRFGIDWLHDVKRLSSVWQSSPRIFFDVGANVGQTALAALDRFPGIAVFSFEPHPSTFEQLRRRMEQRPAVEPVQLALGAEQGSAEMFEYEEQSALNSLVSDAPYVKRFPHNSRKIRVQCETIDAFCAARNLSVIDVLKIDTEGYDLEVLRGAKGLLQDRAVKFIYLEFNQLAGCADQMRGSLCPIADMLAPFGFRFVASYNDYIVPEGDFFAVSNALFALPPEQEAKIS